MPPTMLKRGIFLFFGLIFIACGQEKTYPAPENQLFPIPTTKDDLYETSPELANYVPADSLQIKKIKNTQDEYAIEYGYSFGECFGFCEEQILLSSEGILQTWHRWEDDLTLTVYIPINSTTYQNLTTSILFDDYLDFSEDLGCGDCADGGYEYLKISNNIVSKTISGTYGYSCPPVEHVLAYLRKL